MRLSVDLLRLAETNSLESTDFVKWCEETGPTLQSAADALAFQIASDYFQGALDYVFCDRVMNGLMNAACSEQFLAATDRDLPTTFKNVYLAFNAGEFIHPGDAAEDDAQFKYTRPMIEKILNCESGPNSPLHTDAPSGLR